MKDHLFYKTKDNYVAYPTVSILYSGCGIGFVLWLLAVSFLQPKKSSTHIQKWKIAQWEFTPGNLDT